MTHSTPCRLALVLAALALAAAGCGPAPAGPATPPGSVPPATGTPLPPTPWDCGWPYCGPTPSATPPAENPFVALLPEGPLPAPPGWRVAPCEGEGPFLCVSEGDTFLGSIEMGRYPLADMPEFRDTLARAGVTPGRFDGAPPEQAAAVVAALRDFVAGFTESLRADRGVTYPAGLTFTPVEPEELPIGRLPGLAYGFAGVYAGGRVHERWLSYSTYDGEALLTFTAAYAPDTPGSFPSDEKLAQFEPFLRQVLAGLRLPVP